MLRRRRLDCTTAQAYCKWTVRFERRCYGNVLLKKPPQARAGSRLPIRISWQLVVLIAGMMALAIVYLATSSNYESQATVPLQRGDQVDSSFVGLQDVHGKPVDESLFKARYRLVAFGFTSCPNVCPLTLLGMHRALELLGGQADLILPVFVSLDPQRDTPAMLSAYVNDFDPRILALTGTEKSVAGVAHRYGIFFRKVPIGAASNEYTVEHSATLLLIDPQQRVLATISSAAAPDAIAAQITRALSSVRI